MVDHYCQNNTDWADSNYDSYKALKKNGSLVEPEKQEVIGDYGCALTCMAMILKSLGYNYSPLSLSNYMLSHGIWRQNHKGNYTGNVDWHAVDRFIAFNEIGSTSIVANDTSWSTKTPIQLDTIDTYLANSFVVVEVANQHSNGSLHTHFVIVTEKKNGHYYIEDPADCSDDPNRTLDQYNGNIYEAIIYKRK